MKGKKLFITTFVFQILLSIGTLSFFLSGYWEYGSGGLKENMYQQAIYNILLFFSSRIVVNIVLPLLFVCFLTAIIYIFRCIFKKAEFPSSKTLVVLYIKFFIITIINSFFYTLAFLVYNFYNYY